MEIVGGVAAALTVQVRANGAGAAPPGSTDPGIGGADEILRPAGDLLNQNIPRLGWRSGPAVGYLGSRRRGGTGGLKPGSDRFLGVPRRRTGNPQDLADSDV